jgi:hypothetical protein
VTGGLHGFRSFLHKFIPAFVLGPSCQNCDDVL